VTFVAFVDESEPRQDRDPGTYILCAVVLPIDSQIESRERMRNLKLPHQTKVHWHEESSVKGRTALVESVASIAAEHLVVVRLGDTASRSERRRRQCLERLCYELHTLGVTRVVIESRGPSDKLDRHLIDTMRAKKVIDSTLRIEHIPGPAEPLLWMPDVVCGAVSQARLGDPAYMNQLRHAMTIIEV
jgi:hypothetical protein